jgi:hypothetical protein
LDKPKTLPTSRMALRVRYEITVGPVRNHRRGQRGVPALVMLIDMLDDFLPPLMLEIDVDVGRLPAFHRHETLEQKSSINPLRTDGRNPEAIANQRIGGRAAALTENAPGLGEADDVVDRQKISGALQFLDDLEFLRQSFPNGPRNAIRIAPSGTFFRQGDKRFVGRRITVTEFARIMRLQFVQREFASLEKPRCLADGPGGIAKKTDHLFGWLQMPLRIGFEKGARLLQRPMLANTGDDILKRAAFRPMIEHVVDGNERDKRSVCRIFQFLQPAPVVAAIKQAGREPYGAMRRGVFQPVQDTDQRLGVDPARRHDDQIETLHLFQKIGQS